MEMEAGLKVTQTLDCKGLLCPLPIIKLAKAIKTLQVGDVIEMLATDPGSVPDMEAFQKQTGHAIAHRDEKDKVYRFLVRKTR